MMEGIRTTYTPHQEEGWFSKLLEPVSLRLGIVALSWIIVANKPIQPLLSARDRGRVPCFLSQKQHVIPDQWHEPCSSRSIHSCNANKGAFYKQKTERRIVLVRKPVYASSDPSSSRRDGSRFFNSIACPLNSSVV